MTGSSRSVLRWYCAKRGAAAAICCQLGVRSREQRTVGGSLAVRVGRCYLLDPDLIAAPGRSPARCRFLAAVVRSTP